MNQYLYQANFNLTNVVTDQGFKKANCDLNSFTDVSEWATESIFQRKFKIDVSAKLIDHQTGVINVLATKMLSNQELQAIAKCIETNLEVLNIGLMTNTETISGSKYTAINWDHDLNHFGLTQAIQN